MSLLPQFKSEAKAPFQRKKGTIIFIIVSLFIHALIIFLLNKGFEHLAQNAPKAPETVWVQLPQQQPDLPIADIDKPDAEEVPDNASAQAVYNQKVKEETVAANSQKSSPAKKQAPVNQEASKKTEAKKEEPKKEAPKEEVAKKENNQLEKFPSQNPSVSKQEVYGKQNESPPAHIPGMPESSPASDGGDFLPNYKVGNRTYLNTLANPNIAYYAELKRRFRSTFNPVPALRGHMNEIARGKIDVVLGVSVNSRGELTDLIVIRSSGLEAYDQEGIRTVRSSSPFSAPPAHLMENGQLNMAWTFVVYL